MMEFGNWLKELLEERGMTMTALAAQVGVNQATVSRWISGQRHPDMQTALKIAIAVGAEPRKVLKRTGHMAEQARPGEGLRAELTNWYAERSELREQLAAFERRLDELDRHIIDRERQLQTLESLDWDILASLQTEQQETLLALMEEDQWLQMADGGIQYNRALPEIEQTPEDRLLDLAGIREEDRQAWSTSERGAFIRGLEFGMQYGRELEQRRQVNSGSSESDDDDEVERPDDQQAG